MSAIVEGSFLQTDGFPIVAEIERGPIDNNADVAYKNFSGKLEFDPSDRVQGFVRAGYFSENRNNGKVGELNDTRWTTVNGGVRARLADDSDLQARVFVDVQRAHFNFLAVTNAATTRNIVRLATDQNVPTNGVGGMAQWSKALGHANAFSAGFDWRWVDGDSQEGAYVPTVPTSITGVTQAATLSVQRVSGGTQQSLGAFVQDIFTPFDKLVLTLSARVDKWNNYDGHFLETTVATGLPTANNRPTIPDSNDTVVSPHIAAMYHASDRISFWGAANSGFRAPTLTELYRQFSVGAITTRPNDQLQPERLVGGEVGVNIAPAQNVSFRVTWFDNQLTNPVLNVTLSPTLAQKQNIPETKVQGVQTDVEYRLGTAWRFFAAYVYDNAKVTDGGPTNVALNGKWLQQVPEEPRVVSGGVLEREVRDRDPRRADRRPAVQRRSERQLHSARDAGERRIRQCLSGGPARLHVGRPECGAQLHAEHPGVLRHAEHAEQDLLRPDQPVDDRHAAAGQRRDENPLRGTIRRNDSQENQRETAELERREMF